MKILVSTTLLSPYRTDWLNELAKEADVTIYRLYTENAEREKAWLAKRPDRCRVVEMKGVTLPKLGLVSRDFIKAVKKGDYDVLILDGYGYATQLLNLSYLNRKHIPYYVNIDGIVPKERESVPAARFKRRLLSRVPFFLCGSRATNKVLASYGVREERIINHPFTSLFEKDLFAAPASPEEKKRLREELGIREGRVVLSVGRFTYLGGYGKGYDVLLKAAHEMDKEIGWYVVGGEATAEFEEMKNRLAPDNAHFIKHTEKEELKKYYRAADAFVLMTVSDVWGLVINEAMACGLPVITTDKCMAGLDLVKNGENGFLLSVGDTDGLVKALEQTLPRSEEMGQRSLDAIRDYTIENLARTHLNAFKGGQA